MSSKKFILGGAVIELTTDVDYVPSAAYSRFAAETDRPADYRVIVSESRDFPEIPKDACVDGNVYIWREDGDLVTVRTYAQEADCPRWQYVFSVLRGNEARVWFHPDFKWDISERLIFEAADVFRMMASLGGIVLHSAFIIKPDGRALLFSGPSGIGKSTQAEIWRKSRGARVINGDRALIMTKAPGESAGEPITANGVFFAGTSGICENESAPLEAIILLRQGTGNRVSRVNGRKVFAALLRQCAYYPFDDENMAAATEILSRIMAAVPIYELSCLPDVSAAELLEKTLKEAENGRRN